MTEAYQIAAASLAAIDLPAWQSRLQALLDERERIERAIETTDDKIRAKAAEVESAKARGPDGSAAADALLDDGDVSAVATKPGLLDAELATLKAGRKELDNRRIILGREIESFRAACAADLAGRVNPVVAEIQNSVQRAAEDLRSGFAGCRAIASATGNAAAERLAKRLEAVLDGLAGDGMVLALCERTPIQVDVAPLELLESVAGAITLANRRIPPEVPFPRPWR